jgi:hypothetical protein
MTSLMSKISRQRIQMWRWHELLPLQENPYHMWRWDELYTNVSPANTLFMHILWNLWMCVIFCEHTLYADFKLILDNTLNIIIWKNDNNFFLVGI